MDKRGIMYRDVIGFGIAGNFAHHLEQAGESEDFIDIVVDNKDAPKGIFPTYVPNCDTFLKEYPFSSDKIRSISDKNIQMEPEVGLLCTISYNENMIQDIKPTHFMAYNDCSIRVAGAEKISHKKNWGSDTKGVSSNLISIDTFSTGGVMDRYSLTSFIKRDSKLIQYGENSEFLGYSYFYEKLKNWIVDKLKNQKEHGPLENLNNLILKADRPDKLLISIGATRYTEFGEKHFLKVGDVLYVLLYDHQLHTHKSVMKMIEDDDFTKDMSVLRQEVI